MIIKSISCVRDMWGNVYMFHFTSILLSLSLSLCLLTIAPEVWAQNDPLWSPACVFKNPHVCWLAELPQLRQTRPSFSSQSPFVSLCFRYIPVLWAVFSDSVLTSRSWKNTVNNTINYGCKAPWICFSFRVLVLCMLPYLGHFNH